MLKSSLVFVKSSLCAVRSSYIGTMRGLQTLTPPPTFDDVEYPERTRLKFIDRVPQYPPTFRPPKMTKMLRLMRGPEEVHNFLLHKQYGIMALCGGRLKWSHFEMMRLAIIRKLDAARTFALWRVDAPWQAVSKKGQGMRMGGGKSAIDHYVTPLKAGRIVLEVGGKVEFEEVKPVLEMIIGRLPFKAMAVSEEIMQKQRAEEKRIEEENINPYTYKYIVQNNLGGCDKWITSIDKKYFGKYV